MQIDPIDYDDQMNMIDPSGECATLVCADVGLVVGLATEYSSSKLYGEHSWEGYICAALGGASNGAINGWFSALRARMGKFLL